MNNRNGAQERIPLERIMYKIDGLFAVNNYAEAGKLLVYWRDEAAVLGDKRGELAMENELIGFFRKQNMREAALASVSRALSLSEELEQGETVPGATVFINCATAYKAFGMAAEALPVFARAERIYKKLLPLSDARFGALYNNMALALEDVGRFEEAGAAYAAALEVMGKIPSGEADAAITWVNLAHMHEKSGNAQEISGCMEKAWALLQSENLRRDDYYAFVLEKCAPSFGYFGDVEKYERLKKESERIYAGA